MPKISRRSFVAGAAATIMSPYLAIGREVGVKHAKYAIGDVRRYGIFPDGVTDWGYEDGAGRLYNAVENARNGAEVFWPAGLYRSGLQITKSGVTFVFEDGAQFAGTIHVTPPDDAPEGAYIENVRFRGPVASYDRVGTIDLRNFVADKITMLSNAEVNTAGNRGRGIHIYHGSRDFRISEIVIEQTDDERNCPVNHAALSIDGYGDNPQRILIGRVHVKGSRTHGIYVTGPDHAFGELIVDGCSWSPLKTFAQEGVTINTGDGCAVLFSRASGRVGKITVSSPPESIPWYPIAFAQQEVVWDAPYTSYKILPSGMAVDEITLHGHFDKGVAVGLGGHTSSAQIDKIVCNRGTIIQNDDATSVISRVYRNAFPSEPVRLQASAPQNKRDQLTKF